MLSISPDAVRDCVAFDAWPDGQHVSKRRAGLPKQRPQRQQGEQVEFFSRNITSLQDSLPQKVHSAYISRVEMMTSTQTFGNMPKGSGGLGSIMAIA